MTRKELATKLYWLNVKRGICSLERGCGEKEWVRRTLNGIGVARGWTKAELERAVKNSLEEISKKN